MNLISWVIGQKDSEGNEWYLMNVVYKGQYSLCANKYDSKVMRFDLRTRDYVDGVCFILNKTSVTNEADLFYPVMDSVQETSSEPPNLTAPVLGSPDSQSF